MTDVNNLKEQLSDLDEKLKALRIQRSKIVNTIDEVTKEDINQKFAKLELNDNDCLILFNKDEFDFSLITTMQIKKINQERQWVTFLEGYYTCEYDDASFRVDSSTISFTSFLALKDQYNIYVTDPCQLSLLQAHLCSLNVKSTNLREYEEAFEKTAGRKIS